MTIINEYYDAQEDRKIMRFFVKTHRRHSCRQNLFPK